MNDNYPRVRPSATGAFYSPPNPEYEATHKVVPADAIWENDR